MRRTSLPSLATLLCVVAVIGVTVWQLDPRLLFSESTTTGGDTGAHLALAAFMKDVLLPHLHLTGWDPGAYDGFPLYTFYFPLPDLIAALLGYVIPFTIAFKMATILGSVTLPIAAWGFGRLAGLERPRPALLALATLPFLFDQTFTIYGGNLYSTMAGEYAFSLGLSAALVFLGLVIRGLRTGRHRVAAILLLVFCVLCHLVAALFALAGVVVALVFIGVTRRRLWWATTVVGSAVLLVAWWAVPFVFEQPFSTNMGWVNVTTYASLLTPRADWWALVLAGAACVIAVLKRDRVVGMLAVLGVAAALALVLDPQGKLYNTRFLPLWFVCAYLLAGLCVAEVGVTIARWGRPFMDHWRTRRMLGFSGLHYVVDERGSVGTGVGSSAGAGSVGGSVVVDRDLYGARPQLSPDLPPPPPRYRHPSGIGPTNRWARHLRRWAPGAVTVPLAGLVLAGAVVMPPLLIGAGSSFQLGPLHLTADNVPGWAQWNYSGYEGKPGWPELEHGVIATMSKVGRQYGCGRAMWEYNANLNRFGTPMALMLLPYWTNNCIDSMEGLLFESASSTPYHFINQSELSAQPSDAMVGLDYGSPNVALGVEHLQLLGVRYFMASSPTIEQQADADSALTLIASSGPWNTPYQGSVVTTTWKVYLVHDSSMVTPLSEQPTVLTGVRAAQGSQSQLTSSQPLTTGAWLPVAQRWYDDPAAWAHELVAGGPSAWPRGTATTSVYASGAALAPVHVSDVRSSTDSISFHVDRTGIPVLVHVSYFPAWHAGGAAGPWRAEPNLMVVVPTSHDVTLSYGTTGAGWLGLVLTLVGVGLVVVLWRRRSAFTLP